MLVDKLKVFAVRAKGMIPPRGVVKAAVCTVEYRVMNLVFVVVPFKPSISRLEPFAMAWTFNCFILLLSELYLLV
jgi:hypothetical protein